MKEPILVKVQAASPEEAFEIALQEGYDLYGKKNKFAPSITQCTMGECQMEFERYLKYNDSKALRLIRELNGGETRIAHYINMGLVHYRIIRARRTVHTYDAVYRQKFIVTDLDGNILLPEADHTFDLKSKADEKAERIFMSGKPVMVRKAEIIMKGSDIVTTFANVATKQIQRTMPAFRRTPTDDFIPIYEYWFFAQVIR